MEILLVTTDWTSVEGGESCMQIFSHEVEWWDCRREKESQAGVQISRGTKLLHVMIKAGHSARIMHTGIANMLMWQRLEEERGLEYIGRYRIMLNTMLLCVMRGTIKVVPYHTLVSCT